MRNDVRSNEYAIERLRQNGWHLWFTAKREGRIFAASKLEDLIKQCERKG
jgi:hypothetical protein